MYFPDKAHMRPEEQYAKVDSQIAPMVAIIEVRVRSELPQELGTHRAPTGALCEGSSRWLYIAYIYSFCQLLK